MNKWKLVRLGLLVFLSTILVACATLGGATSTAVPTSTPVPSATLAPTDTATLTPAPTATSTPTAVMLSAPYQGESSGIKFTIQPPAGWEKDPDPSQIVWHAPGSVDELTISNSSSNGLSAKGISNAAVDLMKVDKSAIIAQGDFTTASKLDAYKTDFKMTASGVDVIVVLYVIHQEPNIVSVTFVRLPTESSDIDNLVDASVSTITIP